MKALGSSTHPERTQAIGPDPSGDAASAWDRDYIAVLQADSATEEGQDAVVTSSHPEIEDPHPFLKELALLREEEAETGEVDLLLIDFDVGEVGVQGQIEVQAGREAVLDVDAGLEGAAAGLRVGRLVARLDHCKRFELQVAVFADILESLEHRR